MANSRDVSERTSQSDVIVIGGGAAGLMAAYSAASRGRKTLLLEKNRKLGVKILMSGGTRCNITHDAEWMEIADAFGDQSRFLKHSLASFSPDQVVTFFHQHQVETKIEATGKIFPTSDKAIDVRDALVRAARAAGAKIATEVAVTSMKKTNDGFVVMSEGKSFRCGKLIITTGGKSFPGCGTTGDGYAWAADFGHSINSPYPALVPIKVGEVWVKDLSGVTIPDAIVQFVNKGESVNVDHRRKSRTEYRGSFLFTHFGCSGPVVLNVSRAVTDPKRSQAGSLVCDWLPDWHEADIREIWSEHRERSGGITLVNSLAEWIPARLIQSLLAEAGIPRERRLSELSREESKKAIEQLKSCSLSVNGTKGFAKAEVTAGGVELAEIDAQSMQSKIVPSLFIAGELLDVDGPIGGYNFQSAFSTGWLAGQSV